MMDIDYLREQLEDAEGRIEALSEENDMWRTVNELLMEGLKYCCDALDASPPLSGPELADLRNRIRTIIEECDY